MATCNKFKTLQKCACGEMFCISHFMPSMHRCQHVSQHGGKEVLKKQLVGAQFAKVDRI